MADHKIHQIKPSTSKEASSNQPQTKDTHPMQNLTELLERSITSSLAIFDKALLGIKANPDISNEMDSSHKEKLSVILECYRVLAQSNNCDEPSYIPDVIGKVQPLVNSDKPLAYNNSFENGIVPEAQAASSNVSCIPESDISFECLEIFEDSDNLNGSSEMCKTPSCGRPFDIESETIENPGSLSDPSDSKECNGTLTLDSPRDYHNKDASSTMETTYRLDAERLLEGSDLGSPEFLYAVTQTRSEGHETSLSRIKMQDSDEPADRDSHNANNAGTCQVAKQHVNGKEAAPIIDLTKEINDRVEEDSRKENNSKDTCISLIEIAPIKVEHDVSMESTDFNVPGVLDAKDKDVFSSSIVIDSLQTPEADKSFECHDSLLHEPVTNTMGTNVFNSLLSIWKYGTEWSLFRPLGSSTIKRQPLSIPDSAPVDTCTEKPDSTSPPVMERHATTAPDDYPECPKGSSHDTINTHQEKTRIVPETTLTETDPSGEYIEPNGPVERNGVSKPDFFHGEEVDNQRASTPDRFAGSKSVSPPYKPYPSTDPFQKVILPLPVTFASPTAVHTSSMKVCENGLNCGDEDGSILSFANKKEEATGPLVAESCCDKPTTYHSMILDIVHVDCEDSRHNVPLESKKMSLDGTEETLLHPSLVKENVLRTNVANEGTNSSVDMSHDVIPTKNVSVEEKVTIISARNLSLECKEALDHNIQDTCQDKRNECHNITRNIGNSSVSVNCSGFSDLMDHESNVGSSAIDQFPEINPSVMRDVQSSIDNSKVSVESNASSAREILDAATEIMTDAFEQEKECFVQSPKEDVHTALQNTEDTPDINPAVRRFASTMGPRGSRSCSDIANEILNATPAMSTESRSTPTPTMHQTDVDGPDKPYECSRSLDAAIDEVIDLNTDGIKEELDVSLPYVTHKKHDINKLSANAATGISETSPNETISPQVYGAKIMSPSEKFAHTVKTTHDFLTPTAKSIQEAENSPSLLLKSTHKPCEAQEVIPGSISGTPLVSLIDNKQTRNASDTMECGSDCPPQWQDTTAVTSQTKTSVANSTERKLAKMNGNVLRSIRCYMSTAFRSLFRVTSEVEPEKALDERVQEQVNDTARQASSKQPVQAALSGQDLPLSTEKQSALTTTSQPICVDELRDQTMEVDIFFLAPEQVRR